MRLWHLVGAVLVVHVVLAVALSPSLFGRDDTSPEGLLKRARELAASEKFEEAQSFYEKMLLQKPEIPAMFADAEREMNEVRVKALQARKKAADEAARVSGEGGSRGGPSNATVLAGASAAATGPTGEVVTPPVVRLPTLPDIGGE
jgi:hypothetical protein